MGGIGNMLKENRTLYVGRLVGEQSLLTRRVRMRLLVFTLGVRCFRPAASRRPAVCRMRACLPSV